MIKTFTHVENGKTMYAVTGVTDNDVALDMVRKHKKAKKDSFMKTHCIKDGYIYNGKLYIGEIPQKKKTACKIVFRNTIDVSKYE